MISASQVRRLISNYLSGDLALQPFAEQFEAQYSELNKVAESEALSLADRVQRYLGRVSAGYCDENDLRAYLYPLSCESAAANIVIGISPFYASVNQFVVEERAFPASGSSSGTSPAVVLGSIVSLPA